MNRYRIEANDRHVGCLDGTELEYVILRDDQIIAACESAALAFYLEAGLSNGDCRGN